MTINISVNTNTTNQPAITNASTVPFAYEMVVNEKGYRDDINYFYYYYPIEGKAKENGITDSVIQNFVSTLMCECRNNATVADIYSGVVVPYKNDTLGIIEKVLVSQEMDYQVVARAYVDNATMIGSSAYVQMKVKAFEGLIPGEFGRLASPYIPGRDL